jgi:hypothetical protein
MGAGNCYPAAWNAIHDKYPQEKDWVVVHALRDIFKGGKHYGGHAFLRNTKTNKVFDDSISAKQIDGSVDGVVDGMDFDEYVEKTHVLTEGKYVYKEYTIKELNQWTFKDQTHEPFELAKEQWMLSDEEFQQRFPGFKSQADYIRNYYWPNFEPHWEKLEKMNEAASK